MSQYHDVKDKEYQCRCGWLGPLEDCPKELFSDLFDAYCPACDAKLDSILFPPLDDRERRLEEMDRATLKSEDQLPEIEGEELRFIWDWVEESWLNTWYVIRHGDTVVWRQPAYFEDADIIPEVVEVFKRKYGARFKEIAFTSATLLPLLGDRISFMRFIEGYRIIAKKILISSDNSLSFY